MSSHCRQNLRLPLRMIFAIAAVAVLPVGKADDAADFFESKIRPLLIDNCVSCHGPDQQESGLRLDSREQIRSGTSDTEALVVPGDPAASRLLQVMLYREDDTQMPPKAKLDDSQIAAVRQWIDTGAHWPESHEFGMAAAVDKDAWRKHWAFQPITDPPMPAIFEEGWHPIDAFVRQQLVHQDVAPAPMADGRTLTRRISYAITGLPPSLNDLHVASSSSEPAAQRTWLTEYTDRLLGSPQYGERWARYWLDISRYADTKGYVFREDREYPDAWQFRDWVIDSLNSDMPYDEFLRRQIAADQLPGSDNSKQLAAMGFLTLGRRFLNNKQDIIDDRIDVLSRGTMALTVTCARCHDHKFDPIPTADYYSLFGVFDSSDEPKNEPSTLRLVDRAKPREPVIFVRGNARSRGERVPRQFLTALSTGEPEPFQNGSGRLELAEKIASEQNPLTARVAVNRIWMRLFGRGLVESASDFGVRTPPPTHPELLDHLSTWFIRNQWSRKALVRYITTSWTWRQSSASRHDLASVDPENQWLARMPRRRLDLEAFRDSLLSVAGNLDQTVGGKSVDITALPTPTRRTVYARIDRQNLPGTFRTFDFASPDSHAAKRFETTVPQQALFQLNNPFVMGQAQQLIEHLQLSGDTPSVDLASAVYRQVLKRPPNASELQAAAQFLDGSEQLIPDGDQTVGWQYGWGEISEDRQRLNSFHSLPTFHEGRWGGGAALPDKQLGWSSLTKRGGHPGHGRQHCVIRRWVADQDCFVSISGRIAHASEHGDGVSGHVLFQQGSVGKARVHNTSQAITVEQLKLRAGEAVDFVVFCEANESHDSFTWQIEVHQASATGVKLRQWNSEKDFSETPATERLAPIAQLAQALMLTNEFMFVD